MNDSVPSVFRNRRYLVDKRFQMKYTMMVVLFSAVIYLVLGYLLYRKEMANSEILQIQNLELSRLVSAQDVHILYYLLAFFLLQVASLFVLGILITHRIAGPMYRIHRYLGDWAETGTIRALEPVRSQDEFQDFFDSLGAVITKLKGREEGRGKALQELLLELEKAKGDPGRVEKCRTLAQQLLQLG